MAPLGSHRFDDIPFDAERSLVRLVTRADVIRTLPSMRLDFQLVAVDAMGERVLGNYYLDHTGFAK